MSHEQEHTQQQPDQGEALSVLRDIWHATAQTSEDIDEACGVTRSCKSMEQVGFDNFTADPEDDLNTAWRAQLKREGKFNPDATTVHDLIFGSAEQRQ
jgi:hypothetical protein